MTLLALGINYQSASLTVREKVAFSPDQMEAALSNACHHVGLREVVILSTCNRTEIIVFAEENNAQLDNNTIPMANPVAADYATKTGDAVLTWLVNYHSVSELELRQCWYQHRSQDAIRHMIRVASGLNSMVMGEPQIFGQMKSAFAVAQKAGTVGRELARVFAHIFSSAKRVRTDTAIGKNPVSVAYAAVALSSRIFSDLSQTSALLIGAGETIELVAQHLVEGGVSRIVVANRTLSRAAELAQRFSAQAVVLADIPEQLVNADIVISSTASQLPILGKGAVEQALKIRKHKPIFMVDIAVPRDIEAQVGELADVYLYCIDDLTDIIEKNRRSRNDEAIKANVIIEQGVEQYQRQLRSLDAVSTLKAYRLQAEKCRDSELIKALQQLEKGNPPEQVLSSLARGLTNKLIHTPSIKMKKASEEGRDDVISWTQELFGLSTDDNQDDNQDGNQKNK